MFGDESMLSARVFFDAGVCFVRRCFWCGTDHLPEIGPWGLPFFGPPPPNPEGRKTGTANYQRVEKRMLIFDLTY